MNIEEIYETKGLFFFAKEIADMYTRFEKTIESDENFSLASDEVGELFDELLIMFMKKQMGDSEFSRVAKI